VTLDCPTLDLALVEHLEAIFPDRSPDLDMSLDAIRDAAGAARVTRYLRSMWQEQQESPSVPNAWPKLPPH
jgi:hypothetical protein